MPVPVTIRRPRPLLWLRLAVLGIVAGWALMEATSRDCASPEALAPYWLAGVLFGAGTALTMWQALRPEAVIIDADGFTVLDGASRAFTAWRDVAWFRAMRGGVIYRLADHVVRGFEDEDREFVLAGYGWSAARLARRLTAAKTASS